MGPQLISGRYQVVERLGRGAMGVVYKAYDPILGRHIAVKQMAEGICEDSQLRQRFSQEARAAASLNHPNIVTIYEFEDHGGEICIVMELLEGVDLATLTARNVAVPLEARLNIIAQVCDGLDFAHRAGVIHRDVKPANLHVSPAGVVKILDFGIARLASSKMSTSGQVVGTPDYMSPEQVMAGQLDARSDLFAVGAVLYELLTGSKPFEADSVTAVLIKIVRDPHVPLREKAPHLPASLIALVERALAKNPADRPQTAQEMRAGLIACSLGGHSPLDPATIISLSNVVTAETLRSRTSVQSQAPDPVAPSQHAGSSPGELRLAGLALERGRALRESGDLAGAMGVFRSVLETVPGHSDALQELAGLEKAIGELSSSKAHGRVRVPSVTGGVAAGFSLSKKTFAYAAIAVTSLALITVGALAYRSSHAPQPGSTVTSRDPDSPKSAAVVPSPSAVSSPTVPPPPAVVPPPAKPSDPPRTTVAPPKPMGERGIPLNKPDDAPREPTDRPVVTPNHSLTIPDGSEVRLRLSQPLSSGDAKPGQAIDFTVAADVTVNGQVVIRRGAPARGSVVSVTSQRLRRAGKLEFKFESVDGGKGQEIRLQGMHADQGKSGRLRSDEVEFDPSAEFVATVAGNTSMSPASASAPVAREPSGGPATSASASLHFTIYISAPERDGFKDTSKPTQDSIADIAKQIPRQENGLVTVTTQSPRADVTLTVVERGVGSQQYGQRVSFQRYYGGAELETTPMIANTYWLSTILQVGKYKKEFTGRWVDSNPVGPFSMGAWTNCANQVARNVVSWVAANSERLRRETNK
jgi:serine/threonine protein kinase